MYLCVHSLINVHVVSTPVTSGPRKMVRASCSWNYMYIMQGSGDPVNNTIICTESFILADNSQ